MRRASALSLAPKTQAGPDTSADPDRTTAKTRLTREVNDRSIEGASKMLEQCCQQFDVVDADMDFTPYKVLIMPDRIRCTPDLAAKVSAYIQGGGAEIASLESGMYPDAGEFVIEEFGVVSLGRGPVASDGEPSRGRAIGRNDYTDFVLPRGEMANGLTESEYTMYSKGHDLAAAEGATVLGDLVKPCFYRTWEHFCSHQQGPSIGEVGGAGIVQNGRCVFFAHAVFAVYAEEGPTWCRQLVANALDRLLPEPALRHNGPKAVIATLNEQAKEGRRIVHLLYYVPELRSHHRSLVEDVVPLYDLEISLRKDAPVKAVKLVPCGGDVPFSEVDGRIVFTLPRLNGHQMIEVV